MLLTDDELWKLWNSYGIDNMNKQEAMNFAKTVIEEEIKLIKHQGAVAYLQTQNGCSIVCEEPLWKEDFLAGWSEEALYKLP